MRKFSQRTLRDFGFGKRLSMQGVIELEITDLCQRIRREINNREGVIRVKINFVAPILNVMWCMVAGFRYEQDDPKLQQMLELNFNTTKSQTFADPIRALFPLIGKVFPRIFGDYTRNKMFNESHEFARVRVTFSQFKSS